MKLYGPKIMWILPNWYSEGWYLNKGNDWPPGCKLEHIIEVRCVIG